MAAIDDSGSSEPAVNWNGDPVEIDHPFVGLGAVVIREELLPTFEGRWNRLRQDIANKLVCDTPPPIHLRWMWGKNPPDKPRNPYTRAKFRQIQDWLHEAVGIIAKFQREPGNLGVLVDFTDRTEFAQAQGLYFSDPSFRPEIEFLQHHNRGATKGFYEKYHKRITSPTAYTLPTMLWQINAAVALAGGNRVEVHVDRFATARGIDTDDVLAASREVAGMEHIHSISEVTMVNSPLCQAADLVAYATNRFFLVKEGIIGKDIPFHSLFSQIHRRLKRLDGQEFATAGQYPVAANLASLSVAYALARYAVAEKHPSFVEEHLVSVAEFHERHAAVFGTATGVSVLSDTTRSMLGLPPLPMAPAKNDRAAVKPRPSD